MKLKRKFIEKPWGQEVLPDIFDGGSGKKIGEIWFEAPKGISPQLMAVSYTHLTLPTICSV